MNYPAGVTGFEYEIAGPDREWTDWRGVSCYTEECPHFETEVDREVDLASYRYEEWGEWTCPGCGVQQEYEGTR